MNFTHINADELRRRSRTQIKQQVAEFALAGLRRPAYAGIFERSTGARTPTYLCALILDGYQRNLIIRLNVVSRDVDREIIRKRYTATIQGLPLGPEQTRIDLARHDPESGSPYLKGTLDLSAAHLVMTVLLHRDAESADPWICVLALRWEA